MNNKSAIGSATATAGGSTSSAIAAAAAANSSYQIQNVQNYIKELEISEGQLSSCIKAIYENKQKDEFMKRLEDKIKQYDHEIEKLCNKNYQDFVDSFYELLNFREDTSNLKQTLVENNVKIQTIGKQLVKKVDELIKEGKKHNNIVQTIEALQKCLPVFDVYRKLNDNMQQKKYYPALKLLEELEIQHLPLIKQYRFSIAIQNSIPKFKKQIENESLSDLKSFLETLRVESELVGKIASSQMAKKNKIDKKYYLLESEVFKSDKESAETTTVSPDDLTQKFPFDVVDFSPLYRNLHMNQILGCKASFADYYRKQRKKQLKLTLQAPNNMDSHNETSSSMHHNVTESESLDAYKRYFHSVTGFFVIEDQIMSSTEGLVDERYLDELANDAIPKLILVIRNAISHCKDAELMLKVKIVVVLFCNTIDEVQFPTTQLSDLLKEIRDMYYDMLLDKWNSKLSVILNDDNYSCLEVKSEADFRKLMKEFPCQVHLNSKSNSNEYPKRMPYSLCVPKIFNEIKEFVNNCVKFADGLNSSQTELDDMVRKPTNKLITDKLRDNISGLIYRVSLAQLVQIVVNTLYFEKSIDLLESHLLIVINATSSKQSGKLQGISVFKDLRSEAEARIYEQLNAKIDELLEMDHFNWVMNDSCGQASDYMKLLLNFLKNILDSFNNLPTSNTLDNDTEEDQSDQFLSENMSKLAQTACISACKHVAQQLMAAMLSTEIKAISFGAFEQLSLDLLQCETFASGIQIEGLDNETILLCFVDVRQLIDLILTKEWSIYLKDHGKSNNKYNRVHANNALILLEKLREGNKKGKGFLSNLGIGSKQADKDDKSLLESAAKQLKLLIAQNSIN